MKLNKFFLMMFASLALLISCSSEDDDSPISPSNTEKWKDYFPMSVGSYWIYESYTADENYAPVDEVSMDSVVVTGIKTIGGKEAFEITRFSDDTVSTEYYYGSGSKLYAWGLMNMFGEEAEEGWGMMADFDLKTPFTIMDTTINDMEIDMGMGMPLTLDVTLKAIMKNGTAKTIKIGGKNYNSYALGFDMNFDGSGSFMNTPIQIKSTTNSTQYYVKSIGLSLINNKTYSESFGESETGYFSQKLIRYNIVK